MWQKTWRPKKTKRGFDSAGEEVLHDTLVNAGVKVKYHPMVIEYQAKPQKYTPDFELPNGIIIEYKGYWEPEDRQMHLRVREQHPELDIRFVFQRDQPITKGSKTKYTQWCAKNNFKCAVGYVPVEWLGEPQKVAPSAEVITMDLVRVKIG